MTPTGDEHATHPSPDQLAEFAEGGADVPADLRTHAAECSVCQETVSSLTAVRTLLRAAPPSVPTPPDVSARITAAIANAADRRADAAYIATERAHGGPVAWFRRRLPRALAAAASVGVIGLAGYVAVLDPSSGDDSSAGSSANEVGDAAVAPEEAAPQDESAPDLEADGNSLRDESLTEGALDAAVIDIWDSRSEYVPDCGSGVADETGGSLVGSAEIGANVLVVVEDPNGDDLQGWLLPGCGFPVEEAVDNVTVPVPTR